MAPGNNDRQPSHTGTIPKTKVRNNCNVPQEAVTPTRRDLASNLVTTSLDWVPVSEYNTRSNYKHSRKAANHSSDQELTDLENSTSFESGFGRFVPVRPQPRALPLNVQNRDNIPVEHHEDSAGPSVSGHHLHPYAHQMQNGLIPHTNHAAAAIMIVNPTTPSAVTGNMPQSFNTSNPNRNNLTRNLNQSRNNFEGNVRGSNNNTPPISNTRTGTKTINLMNNMYEQGQGSFINLNDNSQVHRESARALGEAIVAACPDAAAVERRLGQIREYIRVTSTLVDTMRNSEDEQDVVVRPVSAQSNGSAYSENELWQNEIKNKIEVSQLRLAALKQQQKRLFKYQEETKQQLEEINREKQCEDVHPSTSHENFVGIQNQSYNGNYHHASRMYTANQIGVATTLPHSSDNLHAHQPMGSNIDNDHVHSGQSSHSQDERYSHQDPNIASSEEVAVGGRDSGDEEDGSVLSERARILQHKLRELQLKKQHMENLVSEFQKLQMATRLGSSHNTYSSSGEDSADDEPSRKGTKSGGNIKNDDPFKLMEIKAIKTALQKTKDLMQSVENYETEHLASAQEDTYQMPIHSNIHDNKSEGDGSMGAWSNDGSVCRVRNTLPQRHKYTNEQLCQQLPHQYTHQQSNEANIASLQELAQELRMETEKVMSERARIKDMVSNKEVSRKQKKVNEEVRSSASVSAPGPAERRQMQLRAMLADKQRELDALLNKEKVSPGDVQRANTDSHTASVINQSYNSEQEEPDSRSEQMTLDAHNSRLCSRIGSDSGLVPRPMNAIPSHLGSAYASDSDSASRTKSNQRNRARRRQIPDRHPDDNTAQHNNSNQNICHEARGESSTTNVVQPTTHNNDDADTAPYPHLPPPCWNTTKSNQDARSNQFTQNSHSQTMERLMSTPQMSFPPSMPFSMMPYGMVGGCGCGCSFWGAWCWQQLVVQQREIHQLRDQLNHLEERWRAETASHTLNNQVPPGNRANNYWDNFRSYSRQNLLSASNKINADGHLGIGPAHNPHPLVERSHNTLHHSSSTPPCNTPKRNTNAISSSHNIAQPLQIHNEDLSIRQAQRSLAYERSLSFSSAPDVLNVNQNTDIEHPILHCRNVDESSHTANVPNVNTKRQDATHNPLRNLNISNPIPEIIQSHSNNLNSSTNSKKKSSSKLPAKNSTNRRNYALDYSQTSNINIASTSDTANPNLASTSRVVQDKAASKVFDLLRENVYSEVTALIGVNESHPDFLIQLFRELQLISSDPLRQQVLQSIRNVLSQYSTVPDNHNENARDESRTDAVTTTSDEVNNYHECNLLPVQSVPTNSVLDNSIIRFLLVKSEEICSSELLETLACQILSNIADSRQSQNSKRRLLSLLSKYEGMHVCDISGDIIENLPLFISSACSSESGTCEESAQLSNVLSESSVLQDVAGSLNLFSSSDTQLHLNTCPYDMWPGHLHMDIDSEDLNDNGSQRSSHEGKIDLVNCSEMHNGDLAEADQTCPSDMGDNGGSDHDEMIANAEVLPDVVDTEEATPTEAEAEWLGLDRVPTRLHMEESSEKQKE